MYRRMSANESWYVYADTCNCFKTLEWDRTTLVTWILWDSASETNFTCFPFLYSVKPEDVLLTTDLISNKASQFDVVNFTCSANGNPPVELYHLYENDALIRNSSTGMIKVELMNSGNLTYKCAATNAVGTTSSQDVLIAVDGK